MLQVVQQRACPGLLLGVRDPDFWQALVRWQLPRHSGKILPLNGGNHSFCIERIGPQGGNGKIGGLGQSAHGSSINLPADSPRAFQTMRRAGGGLPDNAGMPPLTGLKRLWPWSCRGRRRMLLLACAVALLTGCADTRFYWQSVGGHLQLMQAARPVARWLDDPQTPDALKTRLRLSQNMRDFAVAELGLPDNASYRSYADVHRSALVWNVVAAPELSLTLHTWCFPVLGCVSYRGYFDEAQAQQQAEMLRAQGLEATVYGVPAYSTLGWMNWVGGDPLVSTFIEYPEGALARLLFHELAHQVLYASGDTTFNESFATAVERLGGRLWLDARASGQSDRESAAYEARRRAFRELLLSTRAELQGVYRNTDGQDLAAQRLRKQYAMQQFRARYATLKAGWGGYAGYDSWVANANNASLGAQAAYDELVPDFEALFVRLGRDWPSFYDAVKQLAALPVGERRTALAGKGITP